MKNPDNALKGAIVLMDVDNFKAVNDQYGHLVGDEVLKHMANSLEETFASVGLIGRFGSAEIAFVRDGASSYQKILSLVDEALYRSKINGKNQYHYAEEKKSSM